MIYFTILISLIAGLALGASAILYFWLKTSETERRLWANKVMIRDGQAKIFPDSMINDTIPGKPPGAVSAKSPFWAGIDKVKEKVHGERQAQPLPDVIKDQIKEKMNGSQS